MGLTCFGQALKRTNHGTHTYGCNTGKPVSHVLIREDGSRKELCEDHAKPILAGLESFHSKGQMLDVQIQPIGSPDPRGV